MTNFLLLIGAGLFSKAVGAFETHAFNKLLGADVDDAGGDGPGSFRVQGNVWHLNCCNPDNVIDGHGWLIFNALFGWSNNASCTFVSRFCVLTISLTGVWNLVGTVLSYVFYWIAVIAVLIFMKFNEVSDFFLNVICTRYSRILSSSLGSHEVDGVRI